MPDRDQGSFEMPIFGPSPRQTEASTSCRRYRRRPVQIPSTAFGFCRGKVVVVFVLLHGFSGQSTRSLLLDLDIRMRALSWRRCGNRTSRRRWNSRLWCPSRLRWKRLGIESCGERRCRCPHMIGVNGNRDAKQQSQEETAEKQSERVG
jgi:hypothetical protein